MNQLLASCIGWWVDKCEHRPLPVLLWVLLVTVAAGMVVARYSAIDSDLGKLIRPSGEVAWYTNNEAYKRAFPVLQQTALVVVSGADFVAVDTTAGRLADAFSASGGFEFVFAPSQGRFLREHQLYFPDDELLTRWIAGVQYDYGALLRLADGADLANAAYTFADQVQATDGLRLPTVMTSIAAAFQPEQDTARYLTEQLAVYPHLVPTDKGTHYAVVMLKGPQQLHERLPNDQLVRHIRRVIDATPVEAGTEVRLTGEVPLANEEIGAALDGIGIAGSLSLVLLAVILGVGMRSARVIASIFAVLGVGVVWTLAFATLTVGSFNTLALVFVVMFFGLGVDFAVHFALRMRESRRTYAHDDEAEVDAARGVGPALLLCVLTTCIGFLSFAPTDYRGLAELGVISAGGMVIAFVLTLTLLPALFTLLKIPVRASDEQLTWLHQLRLPSLPVLAVSGALAVAAVFVARHLVFDYSVLAMRDASSEAMRTLLELQSSGFTTDYSIVVLADDAAEARHLKATLTRLPEVGDVLIPEDLVPGEQAAKQEKLAGLNALLAGIESVEPGGSGEGLPDAIGYLAEAASFVANADKATYATLLDGLRRVQDDPARIAALDAALATGVRQDLDKLRVLLSAQPFGFADLPADLRARLVDAEGRQLVTVQPAGTLDSRAATERFIDAVAAVTPKVAGRAVVEWGVGEVAVNAFLEAVALAVTGIALVLVVFFRGIVLPLLVLVPLALTTLFTFALMVLSGLTLNMANILVIPLIFGLGVDAGIHVVHRFRDGGGVAAVFASSTAKAVLLSALTTIGTFFSLSFSPHKGAASVGMLLTMAISVMLLVTFVVLPALLDMLQRKREP
ncbi:MAG: MMPL family transporter [Pseudomonadales bacterium]|nr:MMPL family transporter [Pseudomonadales bacterium]MCP5182524.1 MMPL family transporter [Pseudomonadales bacterium]